jgi:pentatricopeptide repeat protein
MQKRGKNAIYKKGIKTSSLYDSLSSMQNLAKEKTTFKFNNTGFQSLSSDSFPIPDILPRLGRQENNTTFYFPPIERDFEKALTNGNNSKALILLLDHRSKKQPMSITLNNKLLQLCSTLGYYTMAIQIYNEMLKNNQLNEKTFQIMMDYHLKERFFGRAIETFSELLNRGTIPSLDSFNTILEGLVKCGKYDLAWPLIQIMIQEGIRLDSTSFSILMKISMFNRDTEKLKFTTNLLSQYGFAFTSIMHNALLTCLTLIGRVADANILFESMTKGQTNDINVHTYIKMININFECRRFERVIELFEALKKQGIRPNKYIYARVFLAMKELKRKDDVAKEKSMPDYKKTMSNSFQFNDRNDWATRALNNLEFLGVTNSDQRYIQNHS